MENLGPASEIDGGWRKVLCQSAVLFEGMEFE